MIAVIVTYNPPSHLSRDAGPGKEKTHRLVAPNFLKQLSEVGVHLHAQYSSKTQYNHNSITNVRMFKLYFS